MRCLICRKIIGKDNRMDSEELNRLAKKARVYGVDDLSEIERLALLGVCKECYSENKE